MNYRWIAAVGLTACLLAGCGHAQAAASVASSAASAPLPSASAAASSEQEAPAPTLSSVSLTAPKGFAAQQLDGYELAYADPADGSSILVYNAGSTFGFDTIDQAMLEEQMLSQYADYKDVKATGYDDADRLGCAARRLDVSASYQDVAITQTLLLIKGENAVCVVFTDLSGSGSHADAFAACMETLQPVTVYSTPAPDASSVAAAAASSAAK